MTYRRADGLGELSAFAELAAKHKIATAAIVKLDEIVTCLHNRELEGRIWIDDAMKAKIDAYRTQYGA